MPRTSKEERIAKYPTIRFNCAKCKKLVIADSTNELDKRTRFCCAKCERNYWRHPPKNPTHLRNHLNYERDLDPNKYDE